MSGPSPLALVTGGGPLESKFRTRKGAVTNRLVLTAEQIKRALFAIEAGGSPDIAAHYAGIDVLSFRRLLERGAADPLSPSATLTRAVESARARHAVKMLGVVNQAAHDGEARAAQWLLERVHGYAARSVQSVKVDGATGSVGSFAELMSKAEADDRDFGPLDADDGITAEVMEDDEP